MNRMVKKIQKEEDLEIKVSSQKKETFVTRWFKDYAVNNSLELKIVCDLTARSAQEQFDLHSTTGNNETYAVIYYVTFISILEFIRGKQKRYNNFTIAICNSVNIGYTNNDDEENEKVGNFMPIMDYIGINRSIVGNTSETDPDVATENFLRWKELNIKKNVEYYKDIQEMAYDKLLKDYKVHLRTSEAVIPLFCTFMDFIVSILKEKYKEAQGTDVSEVSMNVLGLFDIFFSYNEEDNVDVIEFQPNILMKLALKSDSVAGRE